MNQPFTLAQQALTLKQSENDSFTSHNSEASETDFQSLGVRISDIVKTIPDECFEKNERKAWFFACTNMLAVAVGTYGTAVLPGYFLLLTWMLTGTSLAGLFTLGHDCGHYAFSRKRWINEVAGHLFLLPLLYPFHTWCIEHNCHHTRTNKLGRPGWRQIRDMLTGKTDPNWQPIRTEVYFLLTPRNKAIYRAMRGKFWWAGTIINWWDQVTLDASRLSTKELKNVRVSTAIVCLFALIFFPLLITTTGVWGVVKFWLVPWVIYHAWFSTFTLIHHTSPKTDWKVDAEWNAAQANLCGTIHCDYPWWVEFLCHDINYHVPHHVSTAIPFYNLRAAHQSLRQNWQPCIRECQFSWSLLHQITSQCHLYDSTKNCYVSFTDR